MRSLLNSASQFLGLSYNFIGTSLSDIKSWYYDGSDEVSEPHRKLAAAFADFSRQEDYVDASLVMLCVMSAAMAAGLTIGLMSLDPVQVEISCTT